MRFSDLIGWCFVASIFMMWRFSKYSRILIHNKSLEPEEQARYRKKAQMALGAAGSFLALSVLCIILAVLFQ
nr:hypothetical protein [uncultured Oscillibacter sp.]